MSKLYTLKEVSLNNGENDTSVWIIINDSIYDVTSYLNDHPGGPELITEFAGRDATKDFNDFGHSGDAQKMLTKYKIGELIETERKTNRNKSVNLKEKESNKISIENQKRRRFICFCF